MTELPRRKITSICLNVASLAVLGTGELPSVRYVNSPIAARKYLESNFPELVMDLFGIFVGVRENPTSVASDKSVQGVLRGCP